MACIGCEERRRALKDAILHGKLAEATGHTLAGFREMVGWKTEEARDLPALSGKTKAELLAIAADEGVTVDDGATNAEIVEAIEEHREAA